MGISFSGRKKVDNFGFSERKGMREELRHLRRWVLGFSERESLVIERVREIGVVGSIFIYIERDR